MKRILYLALGLLSLGGASAQQSTYKLAYPPGGITIVVPGGTSGPGSGTSAVSSVNNQTGNVWITRSNLTGTQPASSITGLSPIATSGSWLDLSGRPNFAAVATSGRWSDLLEKPSLFSGAWIDVTGKPNFATVATSGSWLDLINRPILFSGAYGDLTGKPALFSGAWGDLSGKPNFSALALSGHWNDVQGKPATYAPSSHTQSAATIVTDSARRFVNDALIARWNAAAGSGFSGAWGDLTGRPVFATVATSGSWFDLFDRPVLFSGAYGDLVGRPNLATVATSGSWLDLINRPILFSGAYGDLTGKPALFSGAWGDLSGRPNFATVATSGSWLDLLNRPVLFSGAYGDLSGKPNFAAVALSGSWADLLGKPALFSGAWGDLTGRPNFATVATSGSWLDLLNRPTTVAASGLTDAATTGQVSVKFNTTDTSRLVQKVTGQRLLTAPEATKLSNTSGTNTGDQILTYNPTTSVLTFTGPNGPVSYTIGSTSQSGAVSVDQWLGATLKGTGRDSANAIDVDLIAEAGRVRSLLTTASVGTINSLTALTRGGLESVYVKDGLRGGTFAYQAGGYSVDNGIVFPAKGGGYWVRQVGRMVFPEWFADSTTTDYSGAILAAASTSYGHVVFRGRYPVKKRTFIQNVDDLTIEFAKGAALVVSADYSQSIVDGNSNSVLILANCARLKVRGINVEGNLSSLSPAPTSSYSSEINGVKISGCENALLEDFTVTNMPSSGVYANDCAGLTIRRGKVDKPYAHGIFTLRCTDVDISYNRIFGLGDAVAFNKQNTAFGGIGILCQKGEHVNLHHNRIFDTIDTGSKTEGVNDVVYSANIVVRPGKDGLKFQSYTDVPSVTGCVMRDNFVFDLQYRRVDGTSCYQAFDADNVKFINNTAISWSRKDSTGALKNDDYAFLIQAGAVRSTNLLFDGNTVTNTARGIQVNAADGVKIINNTVNNIYGTALGGSSCTGIDMLDNVVTAPSISTALTQGISLITSTKNVTVSRNRITNMVSGLYASIASGEYAVFTDNRFTTIGGRAFQLLADGSKASPARIPQVIVANNTVVSPLRTIAQLIFEVRPHNFVIDYLDMRRNSIGGTAGGTNNAITVAHTDYNTTTSIGTLDLTGLSVNGNANITAPNVQGTGLLRIIGYPQTAIPTSGVYRLADEIYNSAPAPGGYQKWVCTTAGGFVSGAWTSGSTVTAGTWQSNGGKVYRCTTAGGSTATVAPTHSSGSVTGSDGYIWEYMAATAGVFKGVDIIQN